MNGRIAYAAVFSEVSERTDTPLAMSIAITIVDTLEAADVQTAVWVN